MHTKTSRYLFLKHFIKVRFARFVNQPTEVYNSDFGSNAFLENKSLLMSSL